MKKITQKVSKLSMKKETIAALSATNMEQVVGASGTCTATCESHRCTAALGALAGGATYTVSGYTYQYPN